jgi:hypothetical protein
MNQLAVRAIAGNQEHVLQAAALHLAGEPLGERRQKENAIGDLVIGDAGADKSGVLIR